MRTPCLTYRGSKRALAKEIVDTILSRHKHPFKLYDLFGGGGAITFEASTRPQITEVAYSDINTSIVSLLNHIKRRGVPKEGTDWVSKEEFMVRRNKNDAISGLIKLLWSYGASMGQYCYGENRVEAKRIAHELIVDGFSPGLSSFGIDVPDDILLIINPTKRRTQIIQFLQDKAKKLMEQKGWTDDQRRILKELAGSPIPEPLVRLKSMERLNTFNFSNITFTKAAYNRVAITEDPAEVVLYCDPPYKGHAGYGPTLKHFNYNAFYRWCSRSPYTIYISEYDIPFGEVAQWEHRCTAIPSEKARLVTEKLFCNKVK